MELLSVPGKLFALLAGANLQGCTMESAMGCHPGPLQPRLTSDLSLQLRYDSDEQFVPDFHSETVSRGPG